MECWIVVNPHAISKVPTVDDVSISSIRTGSVVNIWTDTSDPSLAENVNVANR